jgi:hypothetical protein
VVQVPDQADGARSPRGGGGGRLPTLDLDEKEKRYRQDFTVLVLVRDEGGRVVRKMSRRFATGGPLEKAEEARRGRMLVLRETWLTPGRYTVETAVQDAPSGRLGVQRAALEVPSATDTMRVSTLVLVGHAAPRGDGLGGAGPRHAGPADLPERRGPVSASSGRPSFFLVASRPGRRPRATVELHQGDTSVFFVFVEFANAVGRFIFLGGVLLDGIPLGFYELRVMVADGADCVVRWVKVTITF